ncbi:transposase [Streptomyces sp. CG1]|uniref:transposase n=1 Tax=Streptomyces sp. CG1 TaxID=1287523 RepID=UPI0034E1E5A6
MPTRPRAERLCSICRARVLLLGYLPPMRSIATTTLRGLGSLRLCVETYDSSPLGKFTSQVFCAYLDRLARHAGLKVHVIADPYPVHRSPAVRARLAENAERVELHLLPGYSPELNPGELLNADLKHHGHAARATLYGTMLDWLAALAHP